MATYQTLNESQPNETPNTSTLTRKELLKTWALNYSSETCYNYERLQALGQTSAMVPLSVNCIQMTKPGKYKS